MKVKFKRDHLDIKKGQTKDMSNDKANYFIRVGLATEVKESKKASNRKTKELKTDKKTK